MYKTLLTIIKRRPPMLLVLPLVYLFMMALVKWQLSPQIGTVYFLVGGVVGLFFMDAAEVFFKLEPSPFRSILFAAGLAVVSTFLITSSDSFTAIGLVLSLSLNIILWQLGEWQLRKNMNSWYQLIAVQVKPEVQRVISACFVLLFLIQSLLFVVGGMR